MEQIILETSHAPTIKIGLVNGGLRIRGWDREELRADASHDDALELTQNGDTIELSADAGLVLRVPNASEISVERVNGEMLVQSLESEIEIKEVNGQLIAKNSGSLRVGMVNGHLIAKQMEGIVEATRINGNATLHDVEGMASLERVDGNLSYKGISGGMDAKTRGNVTLALDPTPGNEFYIEARGNILCKLDQGVSAVVKAYSKIEEIFVRTLDENVKLHQAENETIFGEGESKIELQANGRVQLSTRQSSPEHEFGADFGKDFGADFESDLESMADDISQQITEQIENRMEHLTEHLTNLSLNLENMSGRGSEAAQRGIERAQRKVERKLAEAQRKIERKAYSAARRQRMEVYRSERTRSSSDPVTDLERQTILQMVQDGKINVDEAELLLGALEGNFKPQTPEPPTPPEAPTPPAAPEPPAPMDEED